MNQEVFIQSLIEKGYFHMENFLPHEAISDLIHELKQKEMRHAKIGKDSDEKVANEIRNDSIYWLDYKDNCSIQNFYLDRMNELMFILNRELYLGLKQFEGHFALYQKGGFYKKHTDQFSGNRDRQVTAITYLNSPLEGGELRIYKKNNPDEIEIDIKPKAGTLVCFLTENIYHEVLPTNDERMSVTGWFRTNIT